MTYKKTRRKKKLVRKSLYLKLPKWARSAVKKAARKKRK